MNLNKSIGQGCQELKLGHFGKLFPFLGGDVSNFIGFCAVCFKPVGLKIFKANDGSLLSFILMVLILRLNDDCDILLQELDVSSVGLIDFLIL